MKTFRLMMVSFLLVAITTTSSVVGEANDVVYCGEGEQVKPNVPYYISFMTSDYNMWICRQRLMGSSSPCPQQPVMFQHPNIAPQQIMFELLSTSSDTVVRESTPLKIKFVNPGNCGESGYWRVVQKSSLEGEVVLNGSKSNNDTTFFIHQTNEYYKFSVGDSAYPMSISLSNNNPISRLIAKRYSGEMEIYFYRYTNTTN